MRNSLPKIIMPITEEDGHARKVGPRMARIRWKRRILTRGHEIELHRIIKDQLPDQLGYPEQLWDRSSVTRLVEEYTGIALHDRTLQAYLDRWGFAPEKPIQSAYQRNPILMRSWMRSEYPVIALHARQDRSQPHWLATAPLIPRSKTTGKGMHRSDRSIADPFWEDDDLSILFIVSNRGYQRWLVFRGGLNEVMLTSMLSRVLNNHDRPLHLIVEGHPAIHSTSFRNWEPIRDHRLRLYFLPALLSEPPSGRSPIMQ